MNPTGWRPEFDTRTVAYSDFAAIIVEYKRKRWHSFFTGMQVGIVFGLAVYYFVSTWH